MQEVKARPEQLSLELPGYRQIWNSAEKAGYSGTAVFTRREPLQVTLGMGLDDHDHKGRLITLEFESYYVVCCYTPNAQDELRRIDYRMQWEDDLRAYLTGLDRQKPVIYCGDLNCAHRGNRPEEPRPQPRPPGLLRSGAQPVHAAAGLRILRHLPHAAPRSARLQLVELSQRRPRPGTWAGASTTCWSPTG